MISTEDLSLARHSHVRDSSEIDHKNFAMDLHLRRAFGGTRISPSATALALATLDGAPFSIPIRAIAGNRRKA